MGIRVNMRTMSASKPIMPMAVGLNIFHLPNRPGIIQKYYETVERLFNQESEYILQALFEHNFMLIIIC